MRAKHALIKKQKSRHLKPTPFKIPGSRLPRQPTIKAQFKITSILNNNKREKCECFSFRMVHRLSSCFIRRKCRGMARHAPTSVYLFAGCTTERREQSIPNTTHHSPLTTHHSPLPTAYCLLPTAFRPLALAPFVNTSTIK